MTQHEGLAAVSGATGFIGSAVVRELISRGRKVRALVEPGANTKNINDLAVERITVDVCDHDGMRQALEGCEAYYHLAAIYRLWLPDPELIYRVNLEGTTTSLLAAQRAGVPKIVYTSSIAAVGLRDDGEPSDETVPFNLHGIASEYILTKHLSERIALRFAEAGLPLTVVNPAFPFGERDNAPTPTGGIVLAVLRGEVPGVGEGGFCAVDVQDVAKAHVEAETKGRVGERYILGNQNISFADFVTMVSEIAGLKPPRMHVPKPVGQGIALGMELWARHVSHQPPRVTLKAAQYMQSNVYFRNDKARRELGLVCTPVQDSVERAIRYFRDNGMAP